MRAGSVRHAVRQFRDYRRRKRALSRSSSPMPLSQKQIEQRQIDKATRIQDQAHAKAVREFLRGKETSRERVRRVQSPEAARASVQAAANRELARQYRELAKQVESRGELIHEPIKKGYQPMVRRRVPPLRDPTDPIPPSP